MGLPFKGFRGSWQVGLQAETGTSADAGCTVKLPGRKAQSAKGYAFVAGLWGSSPGFVMGAL
eukprot:392020-Amphidinium_carterae.1